MDKLIVKNEGTLDRTLRVFAGLVLLALVFFGPKTAWGWLGLILLATGLLGTCPLYRLFGFSTCPVKTTKTAS